MHFARDLGHHVHLDINWPMRDLKTKRGRLRFGEGSHYQTNNSYIFPGLALGIIASKAKRVTDTMIMAAAEELARLVPTQKDKQASLLPSLSDSRQLSRSIAQAVGRQAIQDGQAQVAGEDSLSRELQANIWEPVYVPYERKQ